MRQAENKVFIEGILSEIDIKEVSYNKNGAQKMALSGSIKVRVEQDINKVHKILEIPVYVFANEYTNAGAKNPAFESINTVKNEYISIAAAGEEGADRVRISGANIRMNEYWSQDGRLVAYPRINASFITRVKKDEFKPKAQFTTEFVVRTMTHEVDKDGVETGRLRIEAVLPQWGGRVDVVPFYAENPNVVDAISNYWNIQDTVKVSGKLNFSSSTETYYEDVDFGEPVEKTRTVNVSDLVITGGSQTPLDGDFKFDMTEIKAALAEREVYLQSRKEQASRPKQKSAPAQSGFGNDLGF